MRVREGGKEGRKKERTKGTKEGRKEGRRVGWTDSMKGLDVFIIFKRLLTEF